MLEAAACCQKLETRRNLVNPPPTYTPLLPPFCPLLPPSLCLCCNVHSLYFFLSFFPEGILRAGLCADWAPRLVSERPADYVRLRAETKPAQPLNFTAFGSYSRSSAHFQARCLTTNLTEREKVVTEEGTGKKKYMLLLILIIIIIRLETFLMTPANRMRSVAFTLVDFFNLRASCMRVLVFLYAAGLTEF